MNRRNLFDEMIEERKDSYGYFFLSFLFFFLFFSFFHPLEDEVKKLEICFLKPV